MSRHASKLAAALLLLVALGGCAIQPDLNYRPQPVNLDYAFDASASAEVLVRLTGVRERGEGEHRRPVMIADMRITNRSDQPLRIDAADIELVDADLRRFPTPSFEPASPVTVPARASQLVTAIFAFPADIEPDADDLERVRLAVTLRQDDQTVTRTTMFQDIDPYRSHWDTYPSWHWRTHIGVTRRF